METQRQVHSGHGDREQAMNFWLSIPQSQFSAMVPDYNTKLLIYFCDQPALHISLNRY